MRLLHVIKNGGDGGIRTHVPFQVTAFRVQLVMTTSIRLQSCRKNNNYIIAHLQKKSKHFLKFVFLHKIQVPYLTSFVLPVVFWREISEYLTFLSKSLIIKKYPNMYIYEVL